MRGVAPTHVSALCRVDLAASTSTERPNSREREYNLYRENALAAALCRLWQRHAKIKGVSH